MKFVKFSFNWSFQSHKYILWKKSGNSWLKRNSYRKASKRRQQKKGRKKFEGCLNVRKYCFFFFGNRPASYLSFISCKLALILGPSNCLKHQDWKWPSHQFYFYVPRTYHALALVKIDNFKPTNPIACTYLSNQVLSSLFV